MVNVVLCAFPINVEFIRTVDISGFAVFKRVKNVEMKNYDST